LISFSSHANQPRRGTSDPTGLSEVLEDLAEFRFGSYMLLASNFGFLVAGIKGHNDQVVVCAFRSEVSGLAAELRAPGTGGVVALFGNATCMIFSPLTHFILSKVF
jgi:hypothetical protein